MVRMTIACARCRRLKVKCVHTGTPPCRNCARKGPGESKNCILSEPGPGYRDPSTARKRQQLQLTTHASRPTHEHGTREPTGKGGVADHPPVDSVATHADGDLLHAVAADAVIEAGALFARKFPELRFLHQPSFAQRVHQSWAAMVSNQLDAERRRMRLLCAALLALCAPLATSGAQRLPAVLGPERLVQFVRKHVLSSWMSPPDLVTVQTLVVLAMYEWGIGNGYRAWMCAGMAARMMQSLLVLVKPSSSMSAMEREERNRTFWACYVLDRLIFCGRPQPFALSIYAPHMHWPAGEQDFVFGPTFADTHYTDQEPKPLAWMRGDMDHYYGVLLRGFDIWARIFHFVFSGGRRQPGMCRPENHPWVPGSPWKLLDDELRAWRGAQDDRLFYPATAISGHAALGQAEPFAYINLLYYVSILLLAREYIPFLPTPGALPAGPVDQPLLPLQAPAGWWADRSDDLFTASTQIVALLKDLDDAQAPLKTPFAGFCSFSAATMNLYVANFPSMNLGRSGDMAAIIAMNVAYLADFQTVWTMGRGWWVTIQHCRALYEHVRQDRGLFVGRTRADFEALEYSIHDSRGLPPTEGDVISPSNSAAVQRAPAVDHVRDPGRISHGGVGVDPVSLHGLPQSTPGGVPGDDDLGQIWPLWGEQHTVPFALEGVPLDYNLNMLDPYPP